LRGAYGGLVRVGCAVAVVVLAAGCTHRTVRDEAHRLCDEAFPKADVVAAYLTTVGAVRDRDAGPGLEPAASAWAAHGDADAAAWCYVDQPGADRLAAAATRSEPPIEFARGNFTPDPSGPRIP
jgi:hypothetical protein